MPRLDQLFYSDGGYETIRDDIEFLGACFLIYQSVFDQVSMLDVGS